LLAVAAEEHQAEATGVMVVTEEAVTQHKNSTIQMLRLARQTQEVAVAAVLTTVVGVLRRLVVAE
tara:strand:- start:175 stop:369 length:195 start_codon:yes stop_codon:yes gene_type:complete